MKRGGSDGGTVLVASLLISMLVAAWIAVAVGSTLGRRSMERTFIERDQARLLAESGLALAVFLLDTTEEPITEYTEQLGNGVVHLTFQELAPGVNGVVSTGEVGQNAFIVRARLRDGAGIPHYQWNIAAHEELKGKKGTFDSYDSKLGTYVTQWEQRYGETYRMDDQFNANSRVLGKDAQLGSNYDLIFDQAVISGDIWLPAKAESGHVDYDRQNDEIKGIGPDCGPPEWAEEQTDWKLDMKNTLWKGKFHEHDDGIIFPPLLLSNMLEVEENNDNKLAYRTDGQPVYSDPYYEYMLSQETGDGGDETIDLLRETKLEVEKQEVVVLPEGRYYVDEMRVKDGGTVRVTGPVVIYVGKTFEVDQGTIVTESGFAGDLEIILAGHDLDAELKEAEVAELQALYGGSVPVDELWKLGAGNVKFKHSGTFIGTVYAPTGTVSIEPGSDVCGTILANKIEVKDGAAFHFDEAIADKPVTGLSGGTFIEARW